MLPEQRRAESESIAAHCVIIPFLNRLDQAAACARSLLDQALPTTCLLLIDDGSTPAAAQSAEIAPLLADERVHLIRHARNAGVSAARNSGLHWCRAQGFDIVIMMDSDCKPGPDVISEHLRLHREHPEATCIGATIVGSGTGLWAGLDGVLSWVHASPHEAGGDQAAPEFRAVDHPYHLATTNFSVKLGQLPQRDFVFDERLATGEDCLLIRECRRTGRGVYYSSTPSVVHRDREKLTAVVKHHYRWGHHQYFIQLGGDIAPRCFNPFYRIVFFCCFLPLLPLYALAGSTLNIKPWLSNDMGKLPYYPLMYVIWFLKGIAVLEASARPRHCLLPGRSQVVYETVHRECGP